jgi:hypothetical protein
MDFFIFNDQLDNHEFIEERGDQWRRYEKLNITENYRVKLGSGVISDFILKGFGFISLGIGILLLFLMLYAFVLHPSW